MGGGDRSWCSGWRLRGRVCLMLLLVAKREMMRVIQIPLNGGRRLIGINKKDRRRRRVKKICIS